MASQDSELMVKSLCTHWLGRNDYDEAVANITRKGWS